MAGIKKRGLGRGLESLLGEDIKLGKEGHIGETVTELDISLLQAGKYQPRSRMELERLQELSESIRQKGVISPIIVREIGVQKFEIIAGERRYRASKMAGRKTIPAIVRKMDDKDALAVALIENMQREDLNVMEEALGVQRLISEFSFTHEKAAEAIGRSRSATTNLLRLLKLAKPVQELLMDSRIEMGHARALLSLDGASQISLANEIVAKSMTVREVERFVEKIQNPAPVKKEKKREQKSRDDLILEERLSEALGAQVQISMLRRGRGQVIINFASLDDLDAIVDKLAPEK